MSTEMDIQYLHAEKNGREQTCMSQFVTYSFIIQHIKNRRRNFVDIQNEKCSLLSESSSNFFTQENMGFSKHFGVLNSFWPKCDIQRYSSTPSKCWLEFVV